MRDRVLHAKVFPDEFLQVWKVKVEVLMKSLTAGDVND